MKRIISRFIIFIGISFLVSCGSLQERTLVKSDPNPAANKSTDTGHVKKRFIPSLMNGRVCAINVADSVREELIVLVLCI